MCERPPKLAQSYEHYYWNSVEFLNRLKSTKVLPELIQDIEAKFEQFEKNSSDYEKLFNPRHPTVTEMPTLFIGAPARRYTEDKANDDWQRVESELIMSFPEGFLVGSAAECKKILRKIVVFKWRNDTRFRVIFHGNKVECNYGEHAWCFADGSELKWTDLVKILKRRRNPFVADIVSDCPRANDWVADTIQFNRDKHNQMIIHHINLYCPGKDEKVINYIQADAGDDGTDVGCDKLAFSVNKFRVPKKKEACYHHHPAEFPAEAADSKVQDAEDICEEAETASVAPEPAAAGAAAAEEEDREEEAATPEDPVAEAAAAEAAAAECAGAEAAVKAAEAKSAKVIVVTPKGIWKFYPQGK